MEIKRRVSRQILIGNVPVGGSAPVSVQSMTNTDTRDWRSTVGQIGRLEEAGCEIVRVAILDEQAADALAMIKKVHSHSDNCRYPFRLPSGDRGHALGCRRAFASTLEISAAPKRLKRVIDLAREREIPIRIGVNSGSVEKDLLAKYGHPTPEAMVESALRHIRFFEENDFGLIKVSLKSSDVIATIQSYRLLARKTDYPFHLG